MKRVSCPRCGSYNVFMQAVTEKKSTGCLGFLFWGIFAILTFGIILLIPLLFSKSKTQTQAVCQNCGTRWEL